MDAATSPAVATAGEAAANSASSSSNAEAAAKVPASNAEDDESEARGSGEARGADTMGSSSSSSAAAPAATVVSMSLPDALGALFSLDNQRDFAHGLQVDGVDGGIAALVDSSARRSRVAVSQLVLVDDRSVPGFQMRAIDTNGAVKAPTRDGKIASTRVVLAKGDFLEDTLLNVFSIFDVAMETSGSKAWYTAGELYAFKRGGKEVPCLLLGVVDAGEKTKAGGSDNITLPRLLPVVVPVEMFQSAPFGVLLPGLKYLHNTSVERGVLDSKMVKNVLAAFRVEPNRGIANMFFPEKDVAVSGRARKRGAAINYNESSTPKARSVSSVALRAPRKKVFSDAQLRSPTTQFNVADLNNMSVSVLKMILSSRSQADGGRKNDLVTRVLSGVKKEESSKRRKTAKKMPKKTPKKTPKKKSAQNSRGGGGGGGDSSGGDCTPTWRPRKESVDESSSSISTEEENVLLRAALATAAEKLLQAQQQQHPPHSPAPQQQLQHFQQQQQQQWPQQPQQQQQQQWSQPVFGGGQVMLGNPFGMPSPSPMAIPMGGTRMGGNAMGSSLSSASSAMPSMQHMMVTKIKQDQAMLQMMMGMTQNQMGTPW